MTSRKRGVVSYKESDEEAVEEEEVVEEVVQEEDTRETIDRVLTKRVRPVEGMFLIYCK